MDYSIFKSFIAPACNISGMKIAQTRLLRVHCFGSIANLILILYVLIKLFSHASEKKRNRKDEEFQISHFYWSFSSDIIAMKGLRCVCDLLLAYIHTGDLGL